MALSVTAGRYLAGVVLLLCLSGCALVPAERFEQQALALGFSKQLLTGDGFEHAVFVTDTASGISPLHVYLGGDGSPWLNGRWIAADPTPGRSLMLRLMALDPAPRLYLGRPCYHGLASQSRCHAGLWTDGRYSPEVVDSLTLVLEKRLTQSGHEGLILLGHSGGGTLAMLLAERQPQTRAVITIGGNLDPPRWAAFHGYKPLSVSLNPAGRPPLAAHIYQLHLTGGRDRNVPASMITAALVKQPLAEHWHFAQFDHRCCWERIWPELLEHITTRINADAFPPSR